MSNGKFQNNEERSNYLDSQLNELAKHQEAELLIDFDQAIDEYEKEKTPYSIIFNGKTFLVPREMPFDFATFFFRYCYKKEKGSTRMEVPEDKILRFIELMFGKSMLQSLESGTKRVNMDLVFQKLALPILEKWGYDLQDNEEAKKKIQMIKK